MSLSKTKFREARHCMILVAELARGVNDSQDFFDSIVLHEKPATSREVHALAMGVRTFREASTEPLAALLADRHKVRAIR